jgi:hypothetical protein
VTGDLSALEARVLSAEAQCIQAQCETLVLLNWHGRRDIADEDVRIELRLGFIAGQPGPVDGEALVVDSRSLLKARECSLSGLVDSQIEAGRVTIRSFAINFASLNTAIKLDSPIVVRSSNGRPVSGMPEKLAKAPCFTRSN